MGRGPVHVGAAATSGAGVASVTVVGRSLTAVDIDATCAYALGPDAARWLGTRATAAPWWCTPTAAAASSAAPS